VTSWAGLAPAVVWRPSQRHLLDLAAKVDDERWHLCAPPGAGKTLIGLELARRLDRPTLVLSPTTAIRDQWREQTRHFGADPATFTADDPAVPAPLVSVTYQLLGNPGQAAEELRAAARRLWLARLEAELGTDAARSRLAATEQGDPERAAATVARHERELRRSLGTGEDVGLPREALLGERTVALIEGLAGMGIGTVVLDECHHLLDWWALVVAALVERLGRDRPVAVVGLTATPPEPASAREADNYTGLLGEVDAELHLAALVAEGAVAPWRDGIRIARLQADEAAFVDEWTARFTAELDEALLAETFLAWAVAQVGAPALDTDPAAWSAFWDRDPLAAKALCRWWAQRGMALPSGFAVPPDAAGAIELRDRLLLVDAWLHDPAAEVDPALRQDLVALAGRYGVTFTTQGVRWGRSVADLVCARSSAKGEAAAEVVALEARRRGEGLRALVAVERDTASTAPAEARAVLGEDAGTAARVIAALCAHPDVLDAGVLAVTGRGAWCDAANADRVVAAMGLSVADEQRWVSTEGCDIRGAVRLVGQGPGWSPARWLAAAEAALDDEAARVMVATRGLVGEGWDHPPLNVLVDLSEAATATSTTQLRGRALRLDPHDPRKLVSLWDVAVAHPGSPGDWQRVQRRHGRWWGPDGSGQVVTGPAKLHPRVEVAEPPDGATVEAVNAASAAAVADEAATRAAWAAVDPGGVGTTAVHIRSLRRRRVRTRGPRAGWARYGAIAVGVVAVAALVTTQWPNAVVLGLVAGALAGVGRGRRRDERSTLDALASAVTAGLVAAGDDALAGATVVVDVEASSGLVARVEGVDDDAATRWADALAEALGPLETPRWMVAVPERAWRVPLAVGATREGAEAFAAAFRRRVPQARLVRAGTPEATPLVLAAARERPDDLHRSLRWSGSRPASGPRRP